MREICYLRFLNSPALSAYILLVFILHLKRKSNAFRVIRYVMMNWHNGQDVKRLTWFVVLSLRSSV